MQPQRCQVIGLHKLQRWNQQRSVRDVSSDHKLVLHGLIL